MEKLFRSAIVIGVLTYLSPFRTEQPAGKQAGEQVSPAPMLPAALSATAVPLWQSLPETARKSIADEVKRQIANEVRNGMYPDEVNASENNAPLHEAGRPSQQNTRKR